MDTLTITMAFPNLKDGESYRLQIKYPNGASQQNMNLIMSNHEITTTFQKPPYTWPTGTYSFFFKRSDASGLPTQNLTCNGTFTVNTTPVQTSCKASIITKPIDPDTKPIFNIKGLSSGDYNIYVNKEVVAPYNPSKGEDIYLCTEDNFNNHEEKCKFNVGFYTVTVESQCGFLGSSCWGNPARQQCNPVVFLVGPMGSGEGGQLEQGRGVIPEFCAQNPKDKRCECILDRGSESCSVGGGSSCPDDGRGPAMRTAIGCIHTNPVELGKDLLKFGLGIGGGLSFLMMLFGAFQMMTSAGNPETLNTGRQRLTSAIIGLLFIILSILFLQIIGWNILQLPGFGKQV